MQRYNSTACTVLGFLQSGAKSGWDLAEEMSGTIGYFWNVSRSQIYRELRTLEADGLVEGSERGARDRRTYEVTAAGRGVFKEWIAQEPGREIYRFPLLLTMWFSEHLADEELEWFARVHRARHQQQLATYETIRDALPPEEYESGPGRVLRFGMLYEQAVLEWFESLAWFSGDEDTPEPNADKPAARGPRRAARSK